MNTKTLILTLSLLFLCSSLWAQAPVANFSSDAKTGCAPIIVNFQDQSTGNPTSWKWDFGNGATSTKQNPSTTYLTAGTYTVTLTVSNTSGSNSVTKTGSITIYDGPTIDFITDKTTSCAPGRIQFTEKSTTSPSTVNSSWLWDFGDGTSSTEKNPMQVYRSTGKFTVFLKITNDKGCSKVFSKPNLITITPGITTNFTNSLPAFCHAPAAINFTNTSAGPGTLTYTWLYGDGSSTTSTNKNSSHVYNQNGTFPVSLVVSSSQGCVDTLSKSTAVTVGGITSNFTTPNILCETNSVTFSNTSVPTPSSSKWVFPDGTSASSINAAKTFNTAGSYNIKLINDYTYCKDTITKTIDVSTKPAIGFTSSSPVSCTAPLTVNFQNGTTGASSYVWTFGDNNSSTLASPSYTYRDSGLYTVKLKAITSEGCTDSLVKTSLVKIKKPLISFSNLPVRGCVPYELNPIAVVNAVDQVVNYEWDFGDGGKATGQFPKYTYTKQGTYTVKLTITTSTGCTVTYALPNAVKVGTKPIVDFSINYTQACASTYFQFTDKSSVPTDEYYWTFGDGGTSNSKDPSYRFTQTGSKNVSHVAYNNGCGASVTKTNIISITPPIAKFTFRPDCTNRLDYTFTDQSTGAETWTWNFGHDNATASGIRTVKHTFPKNGQYTVSLTVTNGSCSYTQSETFWIINQTPNFTASTQVGCKTLRTQFSPSSPVSLTGIFWSFGDGKTSADYQPINSYTRSGSFNVKLITTDQYGCKDSIIKTNFIQVNGPTAAFGSKTNQGCKGLTTTFLDSSRTDGKSDITSWKWSFGDGIGQSIEQSPSYKYDATGNFSVKLIVQDAGGCTDTLTRSNFVQVSTIKASWDAVKESCPKATVTFNNTTSGTYISTWDFGDNTATSSLKSPGHAFQDTGYYSIKLKVRDAVGCEDSLIRDKYLYIGIPVASFTANNLVTYCTPFEGRFTNTSKFYSSNLWKFQSSTSTQRDLVSYYNTTIQDSIKLIVTSPGGCKDSVAKLLDIKSAAEGIVSYGPLMACTPVTVNLQAFEPINAKFMWDFGDGTIIDTTVNAISHVYQDFGKFLPKVILTEQCVVPLRGKDTIIVNGVDARFGLDKKLFCDTGTVAFKDSSVFNNPIVSYRWNFGDGEFSAQKNPVHLFKKAGSFPIRLDVETQAGCKDSVIFSSIKVAQSPRIKIVGDSSVCIGSKVQYAGTFTRTDTSAVQWAWQFPNGISSTIQNPELQQLPAVGNYQVRALVTNSSGCKDSAFLPMHVHNVPTINLPSALTTYAGATLTIPASYSGNVVNYNWSPSQGLSCTNCPQPVVTSKSSNKYEIVATDANGCKQTASINLNVLCQSSNVFVPNTFSPNGDGRNDIFYVRGKGIDHVKLFRIYNRWGDVVFEKREVPANIESDQYGWNGTYKGLKPQPNVYIYQIEAICDNGEIISFQGNVALIQ